MIFFFNMNACPYSLNVTRHFFGFKFFKRKKKKLFKMPAKLWGLVNKK